MKLLLLALVSLLSAEVYPMSQTSQKPAECHILLAEFEKGADELDWLKDIATIFKEDLKLPSQEEIINGLPVGGSEGLSTDELLFEYLKQYQAAKLGVARTKLMREFAKVSKTMGRTPAMQELGDWLGLTDAQLKRLFGPRMLFADWDSLRKAAEELSPSSFKYVIDISKFDQAYLNATLAEIKARKRVILTSAVAGAPVNRAFLASLLNYAKKKDAVVLIYPQNMQTTGLDPVLTNTPGVFVITHHISLSPWMRINRIKLIAKMRDPLMGLERLGLRGQTQIVGAPQARVKTVATIDNILYPHKLVSTGAITDPNYKGEKYIQGRTDELADEDHFMGALVLERSGGVDSLTGLSMSGNYHMRHIEFIPEKSGFSDLGSFYSTDSVTPIRPEVLVLGDIHVGCTDQKLLATLRDQIFKLRPKYVVLHDVLDGHSVSAHDAKKLITLAQKARTGQLNLRTELKQVVAFINSLLDIDSQLKVIVVPSNHDFWLTRWLQEGRFMQDNENREVGVRLAAAMVDNQDPLEHALKAYGVSNDRRMIFLKVGEQYKTDTANRVELGLHGHAGANGGRASLKTVRAATERAVYGHSHTYGRINGTVNVGTLTYRVLPYSKEGVSSWVQSLALVDEFGSIQVLEFQDGQWYGPDNGNVAEPSGDGYFMQGYPYIEANTVTESSMGQVDQYGGH
jgi:hypothetical protein